MSNPSLTPQSPDASSAAAAVLESLCKDVVRHVAESHRPTRTESELASLLAAVVDDPSAPEIEHIAPWMQQVAAALRCDDAAEVAAAVCAMAEVLEDLAFGSLGNELAESCWEAAERLGANPARLRNLYRRVAQDDPQAARLALEACLEALRAGKRGLHQSPLGRTRMLLLATQVAQQLKHEELASLILPHLGMLDCLSLDDIDLARLRTLALKHRATQPADADSRDQVRVIHRFIPDKREADNMARLLPLTQAQPLRRWPASLQWADVLLQEFPWFAPLTERLRLHARLRMAMGSQALALQPTLLVGAKGIGKSSYLARLGELLGTPTMMQSLGGVADNMSFRGAARGWGSARPGAILEFMAEHGCPNPIVMLDELEKVSPSNHNGNLWGTLMGMLEPATAEHFRDDYLLGEVNYSHVNWLATANDTLPLPWALRSRFHIVDLEAPRAEHFELILRQSLQALARELGVLPAMLPALDPPVVAGLRQAYLRTRDLRQTSRLVHDAVARVVPLEPQWAN